MNSFMHQPLEPTTYSLIRDLPMYCLLAIGAASAVLGRESILRTRILEMPDDEFNSYFEGLDVINKQIVLNIRNKATLLDKIENFFK